MGIIGKTMDGRILVGMSIENHARLKTTVGMVMEILDSDIAVSPVVAVETWTAPAQKRKKSKK